MLTAVNLRFLTVRPADVRRCASLLTLLLLPVLASAQKKATPNATAAKHATAAKPQRVATAQDTVKRAPRAPARPPVMPGRRSGDSASIASLDRDSVGDSKWPVKLPGAFTAGALLPRNRIVAFYGNPLSRKMGILGELDPEPMLQKLDREVAAWRAADPSTPVIPALHLIATVAQGSAGRDGKWRARMGDSLIAKVIRWADTRKALVFLDIQVAKSTIHEELPPLLKWLERPNVHLGIDPEFSMKDGSNPGKRIGTYDAADINYVQGVLSQLVREKKLPPKILVVHRFTRKMVTNAHSVRFEPNVQVVIDMDGWGDPTLKISSYRAYVRDDPVQYTGFKLFYKNDIRSGAKMMAPGEVLRLWPKPLYIQYQ